MIKTILRAVLLCIFVFSASGCGNNGASASTGDVYTVNDVQKISLAQKDAGFNIKLPNTLPKDYKFQSVEYVPEQQAITVQYVWNDADFTGEMLFLTQQLVNPQVGYAKGAIVEDVLLGNVWAKYVQGSDNNGTWQNDAPVYWLRWQAHDFYFTLIFTGNETSSKGFIRKEEFIKLAGQLLW